MPNERDGQIAELLKRIEKLEKYVYEVDDAVGRVRRHFGDSVRRLVGEALDIHERVTGLEKRVFPNMHRDLNNLLKIVPFTDEAFNDLDKKKVKTTGNRSAKKLK